MSKVMHYKKMTDSGRELGLRPKSGLSTAVESILESQGYQKKHKQNAGVKNAVEAG